MSAIIEGKAYVTGDNIDTDQIIPAKYLTLVPTIPEEYRKLGGYALCGLPAGAYPARLVEPGGAASDYTIVFGGRNFGCGSSREHAPIALGAAGIKAVIAESFARIFFRNCIATGELYPVECAERLIERVKTGDRVRIDLEACTIEIEGKPPRAEFAPLGQARDVIAAGGLFEYARREGLVKRQEVAP